jgi:hypothetical protein
MILSLVDRMLGRKQPPAPAPRFRPGDSIIIDSWHWEIGSFEAHATVVRVVSEDRLIARVDDCIDHFSVDARDCRHPEDR